MSWRQDRNTNRRDFLRAVPGAFAVAAGAATILTGRSAKAQKAPKNAVAYQNEPKGDQNCANCSFYIPADGGGAGQCQVVAGDIDPNAWCNLWSKRQG